MFVYYIMAVKKKVSKKNNLKKSNKGKIRKKSHTKTRRYKGGKGKKQPPSIVEVQRLKSQYNVDPVTKMYNETDRSVLIKKGVRLSRKRNTEQTTSNI